MNIGHIVRGVCHRLKTLNEPPKNKWPLDKIITGAMDGYKGAYGYTFDIDRPELFSEKVIWYKVFWNREGLVNIVDKYLFKEYLRSKVGGGNTSFRCMELGQMLMICSGIGISFQSRSASNLL